MTNNGFSAAMDTARIGACFMVVVLHVAAMNFGVFDHQWWASNFYDSLTRSCVPVFLMISGVLLLGKQETLAVFFRKDRKSTRLNSSHSCASRMPSSACNKQHN